MALEIFTRLEGDSFVVVLVGYLDTVSAPEVHEAVMKGFYCKARKLVFDLAGVPYVASAGLGVFVQAIKSFPGRVVFAALQPYILQTFKLNAFDTLTTLVATRAEALAL